ERAAGHCGGSSSPPGPVRPPIFDGADFPLASTSRAPIFYAPELRGCGMFAKAEKSEVNAEPDPQPPLPTRNVWSVRQRSPADQRLTRPVSRPDSLKVCSQWKKP